MTVICGLLLTACPKQDREQTEADATKLDTRPDAAIEFDETLTTRVHLRDHFTKVDEIKAALIKGDLGQAIAPAQWMAEHYSEVEYTQLWRPYVQHMREAAVKIGRREGRLAVASGAFVEMGQGCAACHAAVGGPVVEIGEPPREGGAGDARMARHQWALDTLWHGLTGPSRDAWVAGAEVLADAPLGSGRLAPGSAIAREIDELAARVHALGEEARAVDGTSGIPGRIYGELLTTCETCHAALRTE